MSTPPSPSVCASEVTCKPSLKPPPAEPPVEGAEPGTFGSLSFGSNSAGTPSKSASNTLPTTVSGAAAIARFGISAGQVRPSSKKHTTLRGSNSPLSLAISANGTTSKLISKLACGSSAGRWRTTRAKNAGESGSAAMSSNMAMMLLCFKLPTKLVENSGAGSIT